MRLRNKVILAVITASLVSSPLTAFAFGPGDSLAAGTAVDETTAAAVDVVTNRSGGINNGSSATTQTTSTAAAGTVTAPTSTTAAGTSTAAGATSATTAAGSSTTTTAVSTATAYSSNGTLPKVGIDVESIRPYITVPAESTPDPDPILNLYPLASYYATIGGNLVDQSSTHEFNKLVYAPNGFTNLRIEQQNVGRWYYRTYTYQNGWGPWASSNETTPGTTPVQAIMVRVKGYSHTLGTVYTRAVLNDGTLTDWAPEGQAVGVEGGDKYIIGFKMAFVKKGYNIGSTAKPLDNNYGEGVYYDAAGGAHYSIPGDALYTGWGFDDEKQYYFVNGNAVTGWQDIDGYHIYFDEHGVALRDLEPVMGLPGAYKIRINKASRTMTILAKDSSGNYTIPYKVFMVTDGTDTPLGTYKIYEKYRWHFMHTDCYCQFLSRFYNGFLLHSLLYTTPNNRDMSGSDVYNYMDNAISGGCIRLKAADAAWIYNNAPNGTVVEIYSDPWDKGPIEKEAIPQAIPTTQTWDPTDPSITAEQSAADKAAVAEAKSEAASGVIEEKV